MSRSVADIADAATREIRVLNVEWKPDSVLYPEAVSMIIQKAIVQGQLEALKERIAEEKSK